MAPYETVDERQRVGQHPVDSRRVAANTLPELWKKRSLEK
jgi:hypothetical protein